VLSVFATLALLLGWRVGPSPGLKGPTPPTKKEN
jgi:hypothetical protein